MEPLAWTPGEQPVCQQNLDKGAGQACASGTPKTHRRRCLGKNTNVGILLRLLEAEMTSLAASLVKQTVHVEGIERQKDKAPEDHWDQKCKPCSTQQKPH